MLGNNSNFGKLGVLALALMLVASAFVGSAMGHDLSVTVYEDTTETTYDGNITTIDIGSDVESLSTLEANVTAQSTNDMGEQGDLEVFVRSEGASTTSEWGHVGSVSDSATTTLNMSDITLSSYDNPEIVMEVNTDGATYTLDNLVISGTAANTEPTADAGPDQTIVTGSNITFDGSASSDLDNDSLSYEWDVDADGEYELSGVSPSHPDYLSGTPDGFTQEVTLRVTDEHGATATDTMTVTGEAPNSAPTASVTADQTTVSVGENVTFNASGSSDPDGDNLTYMWDFGTSENVTGVSPTYAFDSEGTHNVTLTVSDGNGETATDTIQINVEEASATTTTTTTTTDDDGSAGGGFASGSSTSFAVVALLVLVGAAVAVGKDE